MLKESDKSCEITCTTIDFGVFFPETTEPISILFKNSFGIAKV